MDTFEQCFAIVVGSEGGFSDRTEDPGNWTGGRVGRGICKGTKFGISAAAYPGLDIKSLTIESASEIYRKDYWSPISGDQLPPPLALLMFDAAVNNGVRRAVIWLQGALKVQADGVVGPGTLRAIHDAADIDQGGLTICVELLCRRLAFMSALPTWRVFGSGWARRLFRLPFQACAVKS